MESYDNIEDLWYDIKVHMSLIEDYYLKKLNPKKDAEHIEAMKWYLTNLPKKMNDVTITLSQIEKMKEWASGHPMIPFIKIQLEDVHNSAMADNVSDEDNQENLDHALGMIDECLQQMYHKNHKR